MRTGRHPLQGAFPELRNWYRVGKMFAGERYCTIKRRWIFTYTEYHMKVHVEEGYVKLIGAHTRYICWEEHHHRYKKDVDKL